MATPTLPSSPESFRQYNGRVIEEMFDLGNRLYLQNMLAAQLGVCQYEDDRHDFPCGARGSVFDLESEQIYCAKHFEVIA